MTMVTMMTTQSLLLLLLLLIAERSHAFVVAPRRVLAATTASSVRPLGMSDVPDLDGSESSETGATERLLLQAKQRRQEGLKQEFGLTIKKDGLDPVRALVWAVFGVSQVVFLAMAVALSCGLLLNVMGYGYYLDWDWQQHHQDWQHGPLVIDTLEHIRQEKIMAVEAAKLAVESAAKNACRHRSCNSVCIFFPMTLSTVMKTTHVTTVLCKTKKK